MMRRWLEVLAVMVSFLVGVGIAFCAWEVYYKW